MKRLLPTISIALLPLFFYGQSIKILSDDTNPPITFGMDKIRDAAVQKKWIKDNKLVNPAYSVTITIDSAKIYDIITQNNFTPAKSLDDQCYSIRTGNKGKTKMIYVFAGSGRGAMYGALDVAEAIECNSIAKLKDSDNKPYLINRGIKFNIPMDLRTPTYSDPSDANQLNIANTWDLNFWSEYFDQMAIHRYNVMTWWSLQPFPSMVKVPEFPGTSLDDVWRTKEKYDESFSSTGVEFDKAYLFKNVEVIKKMTIDEKIVFWKKVMQMAADRGIDVYLFTWNMFTYGVNGIDGITKRQNNDTTIAWFRGAVREMIKTYPLLRGIGITAGEGMENRRSDEYSNEKWLWKTYGEGIRDGLKDQPNRKFTLIHRFHWASMKEIQTEFKDLPCRLEVSLKYAIAHMYAIPDPPFILPAMPLLSPQIQSWLTIRNDDIYSFRWANNDFARHFIKSIPEVEKIAGFYMGPDGYCWGRDYLSKLNTGKTPPLIFQKQWYSFMLWGRLGYDPNLPDTIFLQHLPQHFAKINTNELMKGWSASSMIFPWITRFVWGDIDLKWFPEANFSHPRHKGFYTVKDYVEREPMDGSHVEGILPWTREFLSDKKNNSLTPLDVADSLEWFSHVAMASLQRLPKPDHHNPNELHQTLSDIQGFAVIGKYYAEKIRAACDLALLDTTKDEKYRASSLTHLELAKKYWNDYAFIYSIKNKPALYNRVGFVDVNKLKANVQADIDIVRAWKPGEDKLNMNRSTEVPFRN